MKRFFVLLFALLPMMLSAQNLTPKKHPKKDLYGYWGEKRNGKEDFVIKPKFENVHPFVGGYAFVCQKGIWGIIGKDGEFVVAPTYSSASEPYNGITIASLEGKYGLVKECNAILPFRYNTIQYRQNTGFVLMEGNRMGIADKNGKIFIPVEYEDVAKYGDGYKLKANSKYGLADASGKIFIPIEYEDIVTYGKGYKLKKKGLYGLSDANGKIIIPVKYNNITTYRHGYKLTANEQVCLTDKHGKIKYKDVLHLQNDIYIGYSDKLEFLNSNGETVEQPGNVLLYTSNDGKIVERSKDSDNGQYHWNINVVYNTLYNGQGMMVFDKPITSIGGWAFENCKNLTSITIPNSVTSIGEWAFGSCENLTNITIHDSVTNIEFSAFYYCNNVARINVHISDLASYCSANSLSDMLIGAKHLYINGIEITNLSIPNSVTSIGGYTFGNCEGLTNVTIPDSVTEIGSGAFYGCKSLETIHISNSVSELDAETFYGCKSLKAFYGKFASHDNRCLINNGSLLAIAPNGLTEYTIPSSVTSIGGSIFSDCNDLTNITIPNSVTEIEDGAFLRCESLKAFHGHYASYDNRCLVKDGILLAFAPSGLTKYTIPNSVTEIAEFVFPDCKTLTSITIPSSVTSIADGAFSGCDGLTSIYCKSATPPITGGLFIVYAANHTGPHPTVFVPQQTKIYVPRQSVNAYKTTDGWVDYAANIVGYNF